MTLFDQNDTTAVAVKRTRMLADLLRSYVGLVPTWRAEYFDRGSGQKARSVLIVAENVLVALEEVRARMAPTCARAKVTKLPSPLHGTFWVNSPNNQKSELRDSLLAGSFRVVNIRMERLACTIRIICFPRIAGVRVG
jgi:hypothetical protein